MPEIIPNCTWSSRAPTANGLALHRDFAYLRSGLKTCWHAGASGLTGSEPSLRRKCRRGTYTPETIGRSPYRSSRRLIRSSYGWRQRDMVWFGSASS